ncbi:phosphotransferase family protein [Ferdinandcohnia quinoae]|uniref:Phosphotransferase n=1 Tax=Fredinandcohnia quinoae TaxID=2918902 RepID=A0AAW5E4P3_9BACI|nr:phosphotransferase [Fredinandcohnia sp. SECRCQ15]MCH1624862.1 phosphotransferase [Fredinandcohnia sp. SECRCQ15]
MNLEKILFEVGIHSFTSYSEVLGGEDSSVWRIETKGGSCFALRILPRDRHEQFLREERIIKFVGEQGIQVPRVISVILCEDYTVMLMEWATGHTLLQELQEQPEIAYRLGVECGKVLAAIHKISIEDFVINTESDWLKPKGEAEIAVFNKIQGKSCIPSSLLHLDFHPLNVLTDGQQVTAVIDWNNASTGDARFDIARTLSILRLEGPRLGPSFENILLDFEKGWLEGYSATAGEIDSLSLFNAWAGLRMERDLVGKRSDADFERMKQWVNHWMKQDGGEL